MTVVLKTDPLQRRLITGCLVFSSVMVTMDTTIANVVLPVMQGSLNASSDHMPWVITSYIVAGAIATPLAGSLTGPVGRKTILMASLVGFIVSSLLCGLATDLAQMVVFRALQGFTSAALMPLSQSLLFDMYEPEDHPQAMSVFSLGLMIGPVLGPIIGGLISEHSSWRWVFLINLPLAGIALVGLMIYMPSTARTRGTRFDYLGFALLAVAIACVQLVLDRGEAKDWFASTEIFIETILAGGTLYFFILHMMTAKSPFVDIGLFRDWNFVSSLLMVFTLGGTLFAPIVLLAPFLQDMQGYNIVDAGMLLSTRGIGTVMGFLLVPHLMRRIDPRLILVAGSCLIVIALTGMLNFNLEVGTWPIVWTGVVQGFGIGLMFMPISVMGFATLEPRLRDQAAAFYTLVRNLGGSLGVAIGAYVLLVSTDANLVDLYNQFAAFGPNAPEAAALPWPLDNPQGLFLMKQELLRQSRMTGYHNVFMVLIWAAVATLPLILLMRKPVDHPAIR